MKALRVLFDVETASHGWDIRPWPMRCRLYYHRKFTTSGVERRVGVYRVGRWEHAVVWWRAG